MKIIKELIPVILQLERQVASGLKLTQPEREFLEFIVASCWGWVEAATTATIVLSDNSQIVGREVQMQEM